MVRIAKQPWRPTPRNIEVLAAVCALGGRKEAAAALGISVRVVEHHMQLLRVGSHTLSDGQLCLVYAGEIAPHVELNGA